ncbi:MAG TPA: Holliday junction resolvase RuvX [Massilibacterium sp.]|nr:Holliday junction resolvase RuvX [Massilibacterium sp.]
MRVLGLDVGTKTIGVALSDELGWTAQGLETIPRDEKQNFQSGIKRIKELVDKYSIEQIVIGLPKNMDGTIGPRAEASKIFAEKVEDKTGVPVVLWDERLTTMAAERVLIEADVSRKKRKKVIDKMAAVMILQGYLDSK